MAESEGLQKLTEYLKQTRRQAEIAVDNLNGQVSTLVQENDKLTKVIISLQQERDHLRSQVETLQQSSSNKAIFKERDDWRALVDSIQEDRTRLQKELIESQSAQAELNAMVQSLLHKVEYLQEEREVLSNQLRGQRGENDELQLDFLQSLGTPDHEVQSQETSQLISPIKTRDGRKIEFEINSPRSAIRQMKFELRKAYEQMEEEKMLSQQEIVAQYEELADLRRRLNDSHQLAPRTSVPEEPIMKVATAPVEPSASTWMSSIFGYWFSRDSTLPVEAFTV